MCLALFGKYAGLTIYGVAGAIFEIPTFVTVGSSSFAVAWSSVVAIFALLAAIGVGRTWRTGKFRLEKFSTAVFCLAFLGYSFALIYRASTDQDLGALPLAIIPVVLCILPGIRYYSLVNRRFNFGRRRNA